jgi:hypothetical protein
MVRAPAVLAALCLLVAGCGVPHEPAKQAEDVASIAAEGALLAHDAAEGDTIASFRRMHAQALRAQLEELRAAIADRRLAPIAATVSTELRRLEEDAAAAPQVVRELERAAAEAEELAK